MMPSCLPLIAAILMQKLLGSVKLTCPENQCHIMSRLENWKPIRGQGVQGEVAAKMAEDKEKGGRKEAVKLLSTASSITSR